MTTLRLPQKAFYKGGFLNKKFAIHNYKVYKTKLLSSYSFRAYSILSLNELLQQQKNYILKNRERKEETEPL